MLCFSNPHIDCEIIERINRFTVEVKVKGKVGRAFITNTGRLKDLIYRGRGGSASLITLIEELATDFSQ